MKNIQIGSVLESIGDEVPSLVYKRRVVGICGEVVFTIGLLGANTTTPVGFDLISDLETWGWKVKI